VRGRAAVEVGETSAYGTKQHHDLLNQCPLLGVKRTSAKGGRMSAYDPKRTFRLTTTKPPSGLLIYPGTRVAMSRCINLHLIDAPNW